LLALVAIFSLLLFLRTCHASARFAQFVSQSHTVLSLTIVKHAQAPAPPHQRRAFYYNLTPRQGGQACLVGPWNTLSACRDNLGSAQRAHPFACHISGPAGGNCRDLGNGYGYTKTMPNPPTWPVPDNDCTLQSLIHTHERGQWVRFWYSDVGDCTVVIKGKPQPVLPAGAFTYYADSQCPGYPWIYIGDRPDQVCN
jgi:hypothetical protein